MADNWGNDITMCNGIGCQLRFGCYRFKAIPNEDYQSYFKEPPVKNVDGVSLCGYFWPTEEFTKMQENVRKVSGETME